MENEKRITENRKCPQELKASSVIRYPLSVNKICSACGAEARREHAKFCLICGKILIEDYEPLDNLRASNRLQGKLLHIKNTEKKEIINLFPKNENSVSETAWACLVYSFVPYLGILFVPLAFAVGIFGVAVSFRRPNLGGRKLALVSIALSFVVLAIQIFLWWLFYFIPGSGKNIQL